ncbi:MAG: heme exporter protein CcmD [Hyphomicrobiales bacterium]|nr:heme exporter protein CcmD [Hyphomicrobiales bacterium]MCP5371858.1 heme exporter protein CcmD [Hyphomicrobiales bacterium]
MDAVTDFLAMGGYAAFVWPCFAITAVVMVALLVQSLAALKSREATLRALQQAEEARPRRRRTPQAAPDSTPDTGAEVAREA